MCIVGKSVDPAVCLSKDRQRVSRAHRSHTHVQRRSDTTSIEVQFYVAAFQIHLRTEHVAGVLNVTADALSRNRLQVFRDQRQSAEQECTPIPAVVDKMLISGQPDWLSPDWRAMLSSIGTSGLSPAPPGRMDVHRNDSRSSVSVSDYWHYLHPSKCGFYSWQS